MSFYKMQAGDMLSLFDSAEQTKQLSMELSSLLVAPLFILLSLFWFRNHRNQNKTKSVLPSPPGTTGWPIVGETIDFFLLGRKGIPEKFIQNRMKKYSSQVFKTSLVGQTMAVLCGPEGNKFIFSNEKSLFLPWWPKSVEKIFRIPVGASFPEELNKTRSSLRAFLNPEILYRSTVELDSLAKQQLSINSDHKQVIRAYDLARKYSFMYSCRLYLSIEDPEFVDRLCDPFSRLMTGFTSAHIDLPGTPFNRSIKQTNFIRNELVKVIKQRKIDLVENRSVTRKEKHDVLTYMLMAPEEESKQYYTDDATIAVKLISLFLGHDSVSYVVSFTMKYLAELPDVYNQVLKEQSDIAKSKAPGQLLNTEDLQKMSYTWNVVNEVMRFAPTFQGTFAEALCDTSFAGFSIPKGWKVHWNAFSTHKNPKYFPEPERFDPSRFEGKGPAPYTFVPFGGGPRICPGMAYARCAVLVFLHNLVIRFSWKKLLPDEKIIFDPLPRVENGLLVHLHPH